MSDQEKRLKNKQVTDEKGIHTHRNGLPGRIFHVSIPLPPLAGIPKLKEPVFRSEVFVPDNKTYSPVHISPPLTLRGYHRFKGSWVPGHFQLAKKGLWFYPPTIPGQVVPEAHQEKAVEATESIRHRLFWADGYPTDADIKAVATTVPATSLAMHRKPQRESKFAPNVPVYQKLNDRLPDKELIEGVWGYRFNIEFPEYKQVHQGREWTVKPRPLFNHWVPYDPEYKFHTLQPVDTFGFHEGHNLVRLGNKTFRFWPPRQPGQHVKHDWRQRVERADRGDRVDLVDAPLPTYKDPNAPIPVVEHGSVRGYNYEVRYPPLKTMVKMNQEVGGVQRKVSKGGRAIGTFQPQSTFVYVPNAEYYEPVKVKRPISVKIYENYVPMEGQPNSRINPRPTPAHMEFLFFPPPKQGQKMDKLSDEYKMLADPRNTERVQIFDTRFKQLMDAERGRNDPIPESEARRRKSRKGVLGGQPSQLMKFATMNRLRRNVAANAAPVAPVRAAPPPPPTAQGKLVILPSRPAPPPPPTARVAPTRPAPPPPGAIPQVAVETAEAGPKLQWKPVGSAWGSVVIPTGSGSPATTASGTPTGTESPAASGSVSPTTGSPTSRGRSSSPPATSKQAKRALFPYTDQEAGSGPESAGESDDEDESGPTTAKQPKK